MASSLQKELNRSGEEANILLTGATGFLGAALASRLLDQGFNVYTIARNERRLGPLLGGASSKRLIVLKGDLLRPDDLEKLRCELQDKVGNLPVIVHLVGGGPPLTCNERLAAEIIRLNYITTVNLVSILQKASKPSPSSLFLYFSSLAAMGVPPIRAHTIRYDETTPCNPVLPYGKAKLKTEEFLREQADNNSFKVVILRLPQVYGGKDDPLVRIIRLMRTGLFPVVRNRVGTLPLIHVEDVAEAAYTIIKNADRIRENFDVNLVCERSYSYEYISQLVVKKYGRGGTVNIPFSVMYMAAILNEALFRLFGRPEPLNRATLVSITKERVIDCAKFLQGFQFKFDRSLEATMESCWPDCGNT